ncbi:hypothetical protein PENARI_c051G07937 [Penicillium arizonense]|uniref:AB hydrolase-1 domain-containing protein n=1 Tax=Penicillium arizonense TaxID=1835702 RepID=A0A1F5L2N0_PENAI|nr:hypothetical protein PENARI_c051G07937 [Penicillium arizonense]OGE47297.1 hypothetical protein PENARI_c051G07937 [Penicillium arizonense]
MGPRNLVETSHSPTYVLINSFGTNANLFTAQFNDDKLTTIANLIAIEPLGHGRTECRQTVWTYWDSAYMNLEAMKVLGIQEAFVLGTSQGGFIAARMALIAPEKVKGIILLGTALDAESNRLIAQGSWDGKSIADGMLARWEKHALDGDDFSPPTEYCRRIVESGYGSDASEQLIEFWTKEIRSSYKGEHGRQKLIMMAINLKERDGILARLPYITTPVLWMQGTLDPVFTICTAENEISLFKGSTSARLVIVPGGHHFLSASHPDRVNPQMIQFAQEYSKGHVSKV